MFCSDYHVLWFSQKLALFCYYNMMILRIWICISQWKQCLINFIQYILVNIFQLFISVVTDDVSKLVICSEYIEL